MIWYCCFPTCDWSFVAQILLSVFLCFNPCRTIQTEYFYSIFTLQILWNVKFRLIFLSILFRHAWPNVPNPLLWYCYQFNEFFIPVLYFYILGIPELLLLTTHSFLFWPSKGKLYAIKHMRFPILWPKSSDSIIANRKHFSTVLFINFHASYC
jgi:hypothetical protein